MPGERIITPCDVGNCTFCIGVDCDHACHDENEEGSS